MMTDVFLYDRDEDKVFPMRMSEAARRYNYTDAGTQDRFIVQASDHVTALAAARAWVAVRGDDDEEMMPDDISLIEEPCCPLAGSGRATKTFMTLMVA